jgi:hypothetical protein
VFDAAAPNGRPGALRFTPTGACPAFEVPQEIATPVKEKQRRDDIQVAQLISHGTPTVPVRTGADGGMNPIFLAAVQAHGGTETRIESKSLPGSIPANIRPPGEPMVEPPTGSVGSTISLASTESRPVPPPGSSTQVASAGPTTMFNGLFSSSGDGAKSGGNSQSGGVLGRMFGLHGSPEPTDTASAPKAKPAPAKPTQTASIAAGAVHPKAPTQAQTPVQSDAKSANAGAAKPLRATTAQPPADAPPADAPPADAPSPETVMMRGAQATVPAGSFDSRWSAMH